MLAMSPAETAHGLIHDRGGNARRVPCLDEIAAGGIKESATDRFFALSRPAIFGVVNVFD
jgi:hypothetical protein